MDQHLQEPHLVCHATYVVTEDAPWVEHDKNILQEKHFAWK